MVQRSDSQTYFQRVTVPGMAPHFEPLGANSGEGFLQPAPRPMPRPRTRTRWPVPAWPGRTAGWVLGAGLLVGAGLLAVQQLPALWQAPPAEVLPTAQQQLRLLHTAVDECRGAESLLVMLPEGTEREAALARMQRQQQVIDTWLRDNAAWLAAAHGVGSLNDLRASVAAWRKLQVRIAEAEVVQGFNGRARESRSLMAGPSGEAYRHLLALLDRLAQARPG